LEEEIFLFGDVLSKEGLRHSTSIVRLEVARHAHYSWHRQALRLTAALTDRRHRPRITDSHEEELSAQHLRDFGEGLHRQCRPSLPVAGGC